MKTCFLHELDKQVSQRKNADPNNSYTAQLYQAGQNKILKKLGEETSEVIIASKSGEVDAVVHETADLLYHMLVLIHYHNLSLEQIIEALEKRASQSGLAEKASRTPLKKK